MNKDECCAHRTLVILCVNERDTVYFGAMSDPMMTQNASEDHSNERNVSPNRAVPAGRQGFAWYVLLALGLALFIRFFIAAPYVVSGASMEYTFDNWDYLITDRLSYDFSAPQ